MANALTSSLRRRAKRSTITAGLEISLLLKTLGRMREAAGLGTIFTLHHVRPHRPTDFEPNRHLEVTPEFLDGAIGMLMSEGIDFIPLHDVPARLTSGNTRRFVAITLDDANRNNAEHALPVFERHGVPFTVFVAKGLSERTHGMWWETLAELIGRQDVLSFDFGAGIRQIPLVGAEAKQHAFDRFAAWVHHADEAQAVAAVDRLARKNGIEPLDIVRSLIMDSTELAALARHPLASLGAHTVSHRALSRLGDDEARTEIVESVEYVAGITGDRPASIAYPYGTRAAVSARDTKLAADCGLSVGMTTRPGTLDAGDMARLTSLPRISLNGFYQKPRYASALASGIPIRLLGGKG